VQPRDPADAANDLGVRAIIAYKTVKGALQLVLAAVLLLLLPLGLSPWLHHLAYRLREHATRAFSIRLAELLLNNSTAGKVALAAAALALDGLLTSVEGWALRRGHTWGEWLVVVASGSLLPLEAHALAKTRHWPHLVGLLLNLAIVIYLARQAWLRHRRTKERGQFAE
jgi:uncharacterized membrane protein (DUF2068 family)